jgi:hypothetical protein
MLRGIGRAAGSLGAALVVATAFAGAALGANFPYDGDRAYQDGCRADQEVIYHKYIRDNAGNIYGYVDLMYSPSCITVWAHAHADFPGQGDTIEGHVIRNYDDKQYHCYGAIGDSDCWTAMVYDKNMTSYVVGVVHDSTGDFRAVTASW